MLRVAGFYSFLEASENKLSYEELLEMMWADRRKDKNRLWTAVSRLRKALAPTRVIIKMENEGGYQLVLPKESDDFSQRELFDVSSVRGHFIDFQLVSFSKERFLNRQKKSSIFVMCY